MVSNSLINLTPDPLQSDAEYARFHCSDVPDMETEELIDEFHYLRAHLWGSPADSWPRERVTVLETELRNRGRKWT